MCVFKYQGVAVNLSVQYCSREVWSTLFLSSSSLQILGVQAFLSIRGQSLVSDKPFGLYVRTSLYVF